MKIYTKTGDRGETGLFAGPRVRKDHPRIEAYGTVDELNSLLGLARAEVPPEDMDQVLTQIQHELFALGAELATPAPEKQHYLVSNVAVEHLESVIDQYESRLPPLKEFILPGGTRLAAVLHVARTVCRRAERCVVAVMNERDTVRWEIVEYLNRLSDLLFVLARAANAAEQRPDTPWRKDAS